MLLLIKLVSLFCFINLQLLFANIQCDKIKEKQSPINKQTQEKFMMMLHASVNYDIKRSIHGLKRMKACLNYDLQWFKENSYLYNSEHNFDEFWNEEQILKFCRKRNQKLFADLKQRYTLMKSYLSIVSTEHVGDAVFVDYSPLSDQDVIDKNKMKSFFTINIEHPYRSMADILPLTQSELKKSIDIMNQEHDLYLQGPKKNRAKHFFKVRKQYFLKYQKLLQTTPLLGYISSALPKIAELNELIDSFILKARNRLENTEKDILSFNASISRVIKSTPKLCHVAKKLTSDYESNLFWRELAHAGILIGGIIGCDYFKVLKNSLSKGICKSFFGLGFNAYMIAYETDRYDRALESVFLGADGMGHLMEISKLSERDFSLLFSWLMFPLGTGIPQISKELKQRIKHTLSKYKQ